MPTYSEVWHVKHGPGISDSVSDMQHMDDPAHHVDCRGDQASWVRLPSTRPGSGCHSAERSRQFTKKPFFSRGKMKRLSRTVTRRVEEFSKPAYLFKSRPQAFQRIHRLSAGHCAGRCTSLPGRIHLHNNQIRSAIAQSMIRKPMRNTHTISPFLSDATEARPVRKM